MAELHIIPKRCGTCDHEHALDGCIDCIADGRECLGWTTHPTITEHARERELQEISELGGAPIVNGYMSEGIAHLLMYVEQRAFAENRGEPPGIYAMQLCAKDQRFNVEQNLIQAHKVRMPDELFNDEPLDDPAGTLTDTAIVWHMSNPYPTLAWALTCKGTADDDDGVRRPSHIAVAVDLDGRAYSIARDIDTGDIKSDVQAMQGWARLLRADVAALGPDPVGRLKDDKISGPHTVVMHMAVVTRACMEVRPAC